MAAIITKFENITPSGSVYLHRDYEQLRFGVVLRQVSPMDAKRLLMLNGLNPNSLKEIKSEEKNQDIENRQNSKEIDEVGSNKKIYPLN